jgi:hypothetical protein
MKPTLVILWILTLAATFALARSTPPSPDDTAGRGHVSFAAAFADRDPSTRPYHLAASLQGLGPEELPEALDALETHQLGFTPEEVRQLMLAWARFDAPGAFNWALAWPTPWKHVLQAEAAFAWGYVDGPTAIRAVEALEDEELVVELRPAVMEGWIRGPDRAGVSAHVAAVDDVRRRRRLTFLMAAEIRTQGEEAVQRWVEGLSDDLPNDFKMGAFYHATITLARSDPRAAAAWHERHWDRRYSLGSAPGIARMWTQYHDAPAFLDWVRGLPASDPDRVKDRDETVRDGFRLWLMRDEAEAQTHLEASLPDPIFDPGIHELVRRRAGTDPEAAVAWAERIEDEFIRRRSLQVATDAWVRSDPAGAAAWAAGENVPAPLRERIRRGLAAERGAGPTGVVPGVSLER